MTTYRVTAPVVGYSGEVGSISFAKGVAFVSDVDNDAALIYFRAQGYLVEDVADLPAAESGGAGDAARVAELEVRVAELEAQLAATPPAENATDTPAAPPEPDPIPEQPAKPAAPAKTSSGTAAKGAQAK